MNDSPTNKPPVCTREPIRVVMLLNYLPNHFYSCKLKLADMLEDLTFLLSESMDTSRQWSPNFRKLKVVLQRSISISIKHWHPYGFQYSSRLLIPFGTRRELRRLDPDVVITREVGPRTLQAFLLQRWLGMRYRLIVQVRESEISAMSRGWIRMWLRRRILPRVDHVLVNGESGRNHVMACGVDPAKISIFFSGTDTDVFGRGTVERTPCDALRILYVGELSLRKNIAGFGKVLAEEAKLSGKRMEWLIIGQGPERKKLEAIAWPENLRLRFIEHCKYEDLPAIYEANDVLVMPSLCDEWGMVVNEAMASGLPVLGCTGSQAVVEMVTTGWHGWTYAPGDDNQLRQALRTLFATPSAILSELGRNAKTKALVYSDRQAALLLLETIKKVYHIADAKGHSLAATGGRGGAPAMRSSPIPNVAEIPACTPGESLTVQIPAGTRYPIRVVMLLNYLPNHFLSCLLMVAGRLERLTFLLSEAMDRSREWSPDFKNLEVVVQRSISFISKHKHPYGFDYASKFLIPISTWRDLRHLAPDVVVSLEVGPRTLQAFLLRYLGARYRLIVQVRESEITALSRGKLRMWLRRLILPRVDRVIVNGVSGRNHVVSCGVDPEKISIVASGTDLTVFGHGTGARTAGNALRLLYVGRLIALKNVCDFGRILADEARLSGRPMEWLLVGRGPDRAALDEIAWPENLRLEFIEHCEYKDLPQVYESCDVLVMPSLSDEWGMVVNEAMVSGLPVLGCTGSQAVAEMVTTGRNGWVYAHGDENHLRESLRALFAASPATLAEMGQQAKAVALEHSDEHAAEQMLQAIRAVMA